MTDLKINTATNRLTFANGDLVLTTPGVEAIAQLLSLRLSLYLGEWFLNESDGTPWREQILVRPVDLSTVRSLLLSRIVSCKGIASVASFDLVVNDRTREMTFDFVAVIDPIVPGFGGESVALQGLINPDDPELLCVVETSGSFF